MSLEDELAERRRRVAGVVSAEDQRTVARTIERNRMLQLVEHSLEVGDTLPDFRLPDPSGRATSSDELLDRGPVVLAFFRGGWCPYCDATLRALEAARPAIEAPGAQLVGVAPEKPTELARTAAVRGVGFLLLSDAEGAYAELCGVRYEVPEAHVAFYRRLGIDLAARHGGAGWSLPLPATYVVGRDGVIVYRFVDPDWSYRAEPAALVEAVEALTKARRGTERA
jgi:peroxiredoxin